MLNSDLDTNSDSYNPFNSWMAFAVEATKTTMSLWGGALTPAVEAVAPKPQPKREPVVQVTERAPSWYRAPYRSPFDPMFWLQPDTSRSMMPGLPGLSAMMPSFMPNFMSNFMPTGQMGFPSMGAPFMLPGFGVQGAGQLMPGAMFANPLFSNPMFQSPLFAGALMSNLAQVNPMMANPMLNPMLPGASTGKLAGMAPWMSAGMDVWQPIMASWLAMMPKPAEIAPSMDQAGFSTYRSAGGFAVAQAFMDTAAKPANRVVSSLAGPGLADHGNPWFDLMFPWLRR